MDTIIRDLSKLSPLLVVGGVVDIVDDRYGSGIRASSVEPRDELYLIAYGSPSGGRERDSRRSRGMNSNSNQTAPLREERDTYMVPGEDSRLIEVTWYQISDSVRSQGRPNRDVDFTGVVQILDLNNLLDQLRATLLNFRLPIPNDVSLVSESNQVILCYKALNHISWSIRNGGNMSVDGVRPLQLVTREHVVSVVDHVSSGIPDLVDPAHGQVSDDLVG